MQSEPPRVFYFDIDGTLTDYDDAPKAAFGDGALERALKGLSFDRLFCVSGWADLTANSLTRAPEEHRVRGIYADLLRPLLPDREWFLSHVALGTDADHRCRQIDLTTDWWYADDWADKFFVEHFGREFYERELGKRVLRVDPFADGSDVLAWLKQIPFKKPCGEERPLKEVREIDGAVFLDFEGFATEFALRVLLGTHRWNGNLDALNDILRGGFGTPEDGFTLRILNSAAARRSLGYGATINEVDPVFRTRA